MALVCTAFSRPRSVWTIEQETWTQCDGCSPAASLQWIPRNSAGDVHVDTTLVLGGTGKTGRRIVDRLRRRDLPVRVGSRSGQPSFDWNDLSTWGRALDGVKSAYISFYPDIAIPGAPEAVAAFCEQALKQGTRRLVLLSGRGEAEAQRAEDILRASGADWTILRCSWFMQNFSEAFFLDSVLAGEVALPVGDMPEPFVDVDDIADVAVAALTDDRHIGKLYELTGPRLLTFAQAVEAISAETGRPVRFTSVSMADFSNTLTQQGTPAEVVVFLQYLFAEVLDGRNAHLTNGVEEALGRKPRDFVSYARDAANTGVWHPSRGQ
ncbi:MAG: NAD(P)H-binding protein [Proteobacteria bacterium]|nr:NAD(P)H-binding protein [Pseudomonadota bacterium]